MPYVILFTSVTQLYEAEATLNDKGIPNQLIPAPELPDDSADECGDLALLVDDPDIAKIFDNVKVVEIAEDELEL